MALRVRSLRQGLSRCSILLVLLLGHLSAGLFHDNISAALAQIREPAMREVALGVHELVHALPVNQPRQRLLLLVPLSVALLLQARGRPLRRFEDLVGALLVLRCTLQFVVLNVLLLVPLRGGALLLIQLVLFLPVITIAFGWLYWRLDAGARRHGRTHLRFDDTADDRLDRFDYFHAAGMVLVAFEPSGAKATSRLMKSLFLLHGVVMLDLVALTLSRAIALANGGG